MTLEILALILFASGIGVWAITSERIAALIGGVAGIVYSVIVLLRVL